MTAFTATPAQAEAIRRPPVSYDDEPAPGVNFKGVVTKEALAAVQDHVTHRAYRWAQEEEIDQQAVGLVLTAIFGEQREVPAPVEIPEDVRNYIIDVTVRMTRKEGWCETAEEGLAIVLGWEPPNDDGFRDSDGFDCDGYDKDGYDVRGFNEYGLNREGLNEVEAALRETATKEAAEAANRRLAHDMINGWTPEFRAWMARFLAEIPTA